MAEKKNKNGEGCIALQKDGRWVARIQIGKKSDGRSKIKALYGKSKTEVCIRLMEYKKELALNQEGVTAMTVAEYITRWMLLYKINTVSASTYDRMENTFIYQIQDNIGYIKMGDLRTEDIQVFINQKCKTISYSSIKKIKELLNGCCIQAVRLGHMQQNPMEGIVMPNMKAVEKKTKEIQIYSDEDIAKLQETINSSFNSVIKLYAYSPSYILVFSTGLRLGEVLGLTWDNVNFEERYIVVKNNVTYTKKRNANADKQRELVITTPKTRSGRRMIPLNEKAMDALVELKRRYKVLNIESEYVVCNLKGNLLLPRNHARTLKSLCDRADVTYRGVHAIRHTFASRVIRMGIEIKIVSELMGHSNVQITYNTYVHILQEQRVKAIKELDKL
ncbi:MAG: tyrosine-type recombinase/integrase [bacterium]|nr:tyrosine-type recombinase/integrase [bacterium]